VNRFYLFLLSLALLALAGCVDGAPAITLQTLYNFNGSGDGIEPLGTLVLSTNGYLYGTTYGGGVSGAGTVFAVTPQGTLTPLYSFSGAADGAQPRGALVQGSDGKFYGTTYSGGLASNAGTVFSISATGTLATVYRFGGGGDGAHPSGGLVQGGDGNFYGTTYGGGLKALGTVFSVNSSGSLTTLYDFSGGVDGANPEAGLVAGPGNRFYGTTSGGGSFGLGTVFKISTGGVLNPLYSFAGADDGANPAAGLVLGNNNNLFGTTLNGGANSNGAVFTITATGTLTPLYNFGGGDDGGSPMAELVRGDDGNFYGTTSGGGLSGAGTIFKMTPGGALTTLLSFTGGDGANPQTGLVVGSLTNFYGTTISGGKDDAGTVFSLLEPCAYSLSPSHVTFPAIDESGTFNVTTGLTNCPWTASNSVDWITITSTNSGIGNGTVSYSVTANTNATTRFGGIFVGDKVFVITQQAQLFGQFLPGTYNGLVLAGAPAQTNSGLISLVLGKTGAFQATLMIGSVRSAFKGEFDQTGNATNNVPRKDLSALQVILQLLDVTNETDQITGTVSDGGFTSDVLADLAVFSRVNPCPFAGHYTFVLEPADNTDPTVPQGYGYGTLAVTTLGTGQMQGQLGDGTKIAATFPVSGYGTWPLYESLYDKQGACLGLVSFATNNTLSATVNWFKPPEPKNRDYPGGFTTAVTLSGAIHVSGPTVAGNAQATLGGGNLESNLVKNLVIDAHGNVTVSPLGADKLALKINAATGLFTGSFLDPAIGKAPAKLGGLLLQTDNSGAGFFQGSNQTGFIILEPDP
jgi:uncharacterized repeat protein (TIGR03803 family)